MTKNKLQVPIKNGRGIASLNVAANQKVVEIYKAKARSVMDIQLNRIAQKNLSLAAYALYMHFMSNLHGYKEILSIKAVTATTALGEKNYYKAVNELIEKQYLVKTDNADISNYYIFFEDPRLKAQKEESDWN
jgi:hypothetical protein